MGRGGKLGNKQSSSKRGSKAKNSDDSDDDYTVGDDEECNASDEYCSSFAVDESEEILGEFEEEEEEVKMRKVARSKRQKGISGRKGNGAEKPSKKKKVSYNEDDDEDYDCEDYDDDEEFMPDEIDFVDDEDELVAKKKKNRNVGRQFLREKDFVKGRKRKRKRKRNSKVMKKPMRKKARRNRGFGRKSTASIDMKFTEKNIVVEGRSTQNSGQRKRRLKIKSDPDFRSSGSSDFKYTISEEEREQVREAREFCKRLPTSLKSSYSSNILQGPLHDQHPGRKGKEKVKDLKNEVGKQVCGICLSEEGKKTVQGIINCCNHFFCFSCIMEWSKVESRCPLCKQRFLTISKAARSNTGFDLRTMVVQVPERDQVYQPSEEELRGYLDPYQNVICTECQQGGDDDLMLLCDLCDSPAHTYCVGLGREVPEGNWYCEGCRSTALGFSTPQASNPTTDQRRSNLSGGSSPVDNVGESLDPTSMCVPDTPLTQGTGLFSSPRHRDGDLRAVSPVSAVSGAGAFTVWERLRIQRQIHHLLNNRMGQLDGRTNGISAGLLGNNFSGSEIDQGREASENGISARLLGNSFSGSEIDQGREIAYQDSITSERVAPPSNFFEGRLQDNPTYLAESRDHSSTRFSNSRVLYSDGSVKGRAELDGINVPINLRSDNEQLFPHRSRSSIGSGMSVSPHVRREMSNVTLEKEQVQSMVKSHLKSLSRDMGLGHSTFKDIARSSTHTILAACGLEHRGSEVYPVQPPPICNHVEQMAVGRTSLLKGHCSSCLDSFARDVVHVITNSRVPPFFRG